MGTGRARCLDAFAKWNTQERGGQTWARAIFTRRTCFNPRSGRTGPTGQPGGRWRRWWHGQAVSHIYINEKSMYICMQ